MNQPTGAEPGPAGVGDSSSPSLGVTLGKVFLFTAAFIGLYVLVGVYAARIVGHEGGGAQASIQGVSPEAGEAVFWGKGKCATCHSVADRGSAVRCPNLDGIGGLAEARAAEAGLEHGTAYLVESLVDPAAYAVEGFSGDTMPKVFLPPISLNADEMQAVVMYLQTLGGTADQEAIVLPDEVLAAGAGAAVPAAWRAYMAGDPAAGEDLFRNGAPGAPACAVCHMVGGEGAEVGPELDDIAGVRGPQYIIDSILDPSAEIVAGYENAMPPVFADALTVRQLHDLVAYLMQSAGLPVTGGPNG